MTTTNDAVLKTGMYVITDEDGMVLAVMADWRLSAAQAVAKSFQDALGEPTTLHHLFLTESPVLGETIPMNGLGKLMVSHPAAQPHGIGTDTK